MKGRPVNNKVTNDGIHYFQGQQGGHVLLNRVRFPEDEDQSNFLDSIVDLITAFIACVCIAGLLTILAVLYVTVRPFSLTTYRRLSMQFGAASFLDAIALLLPNMRVYLSGDSDVPSPVGTSVLVSNHFNDYDWWGMLMLGRCVGLRGSMKVFLRNEYLQINMQKAEQASPRPNSAVSNKSTPIKVVSSCSKESAPSNSRASSNPPADLTIMARLLHLFLDFPLLNGDDYVSDREQHFQLMRSFAGNNGSGSPVQFLSFPEGWSLHNGEDRRSVLAKSNEFARKESRPQLKHLLLPRTRGFNASLECLRESSPVVYDVTMAYSGYDGSLPPNVDISLPGLWSFLRHGFPKDIHIRAKRYSMEEVLQDSSWLDKKWVEKDRLLSHFARHQSFPLDKRGYCQHRVFDTKYFGVETSFVSLFCLFLVPCFVPLLILLSIPIFWTILWIWLIYHACNTVFPEGGGRPGSAGKGGQTPGSAGGSASGTPFFPATPFGSPRWFADNHENSP